MTILTRKQLKERLNVTMKFIMENHDALGGIGRKRNYRYILEEAQAFILKLSRESSRRDEDAERSVGDLIRDIDTYIKTSRQVPAGPREMVGRGGRTAEVGKVRSWDGEKGAMP